MTTAQYIMKEMETLCHHILNKETDEAKNMMKNLENKVVFNEIRNIGEDRIVLKATINGYGYSNRTIEVNVTR